MVVPGADAHGHDRHAGLDEPPGQQELLPGPAAADVAFGRVDELAVPGFVAGADALRLAGEVKCFAGLGRRDQVEGLGGERVHGGQAVAVAAEVVQGAEELAAVIEPGGVDVSPQLQAADAVLADQERLVGGADVAGVFKALRSDAVAAEAQIARQGGVAVPPEPADDRAERGPMRRPRESREDLDQVVVALDERHAAHQGETLGDLSVQRQQFADVETGHAAADRLVLAAHLGRRVGFQVPGVELAGPAVEADDDDAFGGFGWGRLGAELEQVGQT